MRTLTFLTTTEQETSFSDHGIITVRQFVNKPISVSLDTGVFDQLELFIFRYIRPLSAN